MTEQIKSLLDVLDDSELRSTDVFTWAAPIPFFGNLYNAVVATVGINPSNREYVDRDGTELVEGQRRFPTLNSLQLPQWGSAEECDLRKIEVACLEYFRSNPYDAWFVQLEALMAPSGISYYPPFETACHLDIVPFVTHTKWGALPTRDKRILHDLSIRSLAASLANSSIKAVVLNGASVSRWFERSIGKRLWCVEMPSWKLRQKSGRHVAGMAYVGAVSRINGIDLGRNVTILGFNHNIQSSFGVTNRVRQSIANWLQSQFQLDSK